METQSGSNRHTDAQTKIPANKQGAALPESKDRASKFAQSEGMTTRLPLPWSRGA